MASAILRQSVSDGLHIDEERGIVKGCRLAEVGALAIFRDPEGKRRELRMTPKLIDSLLACCEKLKRVSSHWTHDWVRSGQDPLTTSVATFRDFRKDEFGNLVADAHTWPCDKRQVILHAAKEDPEGIMLSMVFDYEGKEGDEYATGVAAADFVERGAATTALCSAVLSDFSKHQTATMADDNDTPPEFKEDAEPKEEATPAGGFSPEQEARISELITLALAGHNAQMEVATPAIMSAVEQVLPELLKDDKRMAVLAEAINVRKVGGKPAPTNTGVLEKSEPKGNPLELAVLSEINAGAPNKTVALARALNKTPALYEYRATIK